MRLWLVASWPRTSVRLYRERVGREGIGADWEYGEAVHTDVALVDEPVTDVDAAIAALAPLCSQQRLALFRHVLGQRTSRVRVAYECPSNPSNVWACLRTIDAFGIQNVDLVRDSADAAAARAAARGVAPGARFSMRTDTMTTAMGSQKWLTINDHASPDDMVDALKADGYVVAATDLAAGATDLGSFLRSVEDDKLAFVFGNEEVGVSDSVRARADARVFVPMRGFAESFNLSVSTGVVLAHLAALGLLPPDLPVAEQKSLLLQWLKTSVRASSHILRRKGLLV